MILQMRKERLSADIDQVDLSKKIPSKLEVALHALKMLTDTTTRALYGAKNRKTTLICRKR